MDSGWTIDDNGLVTYLPVGDIDLFDWQMEDIDFESVMKILTEKQKRGELIGIAMTWGDSGIGGTVLVHRDGNIHISLNINRKLIEDTAAIKVTDLNWYTTKLLPLFNQDGYQVISFSYQECI